VLKTVQMINTKMKKPTNVNHVMVLVEVVSDHQTNNVMVVTNQDIYKTANVLIHVQNQVSILMILILEPVNPVTSLVENVPTVVLVLVSSVMKVIS
jgi:hypothetical protein